MGSIRARRGAFDPTAFSGGYAWYRGDTGITPAAGKAAAWADKFGLGRNFAEANTAWQPVINAASANMGGKTTLASASSMTGLKCANFLQGATQATVSITHRPTILAGAPRIFGPPTAAGGSFNLIANSGVPSFDAVCINGGTNMTRVSGLAINTNYVHTAVFDLANAATVDAVVYTNGVAGGTVPSSTASNGAMPATTFHMGYLYDGEIAEIIVYDRILSAGEVAQLAAYQMAWIS